MPTPRSASISKLEFQGYLEKQRAFEHVLHYQEFVSDPDFLVVLTITGKDKWAIFGFYCLALEDLEDAILFRATQLLQCPCVDEDLNRCLVRVLHREGQEWWFLYRPDEIGYVLTEDEQLPWNRLQSGQKQL